MESKQTEWLNKQEAAEALGVSTRTVLAMAKEGRLRSKREIDPASNQVAVQFHAGDVERQRYERQNPEGAQAAQGMHLQPLQASPANATALLRALAGLATTPPHVKPWLTLAEAAEDYGLPASYLLSLIESGELPARNVGVRPGGRWRVRRADLEKLEGLRIENNSTAR